MVCISFKLKWYQKSKESRKNLKKNPKTVFRIKIFNIRIFNLLTNFSFQVYVSCNFCGKAISRYTNGLPESALGTPDLEKRKINATLNLNALQRHTTRFQSCPACKKPTPRCSICLVNMGSHSGYLTGMPSMLPDPSKKRLGIKVTPFSNFFVWCQVCRHGGHAEHIEGNLYEKKSGKLIDWIFQEIWQNATSQDFQKKFKTSRNLGRNGKKLIWHFWSKYSKT